MEPLSAHWGAKIIADNLLVVSIEDITEYLWAPKLNLRNLFWIN